MLETKPEVALKQIQELKSFTTDAISELRQFISDLRPSQLDDLGLVPALRFLADRVTANLDLKVTLTVQGEIWRLDPQAEIILFRIAQEALTNAARHARADQATIELSRHPDHCTLWVSDNGVGFIPEQVIATPKGMGLAGMRERLKMVDGNLSIESSPGHGTRLEAIIPCCDLDGEYEG